MEDDELIYSPLERSETRDGVTVEIYIYRLATEKAWILEVEDQDGGVTIWDDRFATDHDALDAAMRAFDEEGIESFAEAVP